MENNRLNNEAHEAPEVTAEATKKPFFKSNAFKCVVTLLCVLLVSGIFLTIAYGFLKVTDAEREARAIEKIYGNSAKIEQTLNTSSYPSGDYKVEKGYVMSDGNYLIKTTGYGGYNGGSVTCWVVVKVTDKAVSGVGKVVIDGQTGQTLMSQYSDKTLDVFSKNYNGEEFDKSVITGATAKMTNGAITKSVNGSIAYVKSVLSGGSGTVEKTPFDDFKYTELINKKDTKVDFADGKLTYTVKTKEYGAAPSLNLVIVVNSDKQIESFKVNGDLTQDYEEIGDVPNVASILKGKDISYFTNKYGEDMAYKAIASYTDSDVTTGASDESIASNSTYLCMYAGAFATANYDKALMLGIKYTANINMSGTTWTVADGKVTYTVKTKEYGAAPSLSLVIVVNSDKQIESFKVNGDLTQDYEEIGVAPNVASILKGKDLSYFTNKYGEDMTYKAIASYTDSDVTTGATDESIASNSTYLCMYAGAFATANYDLALSIGGNANE